MSNMFNNCYLLNNLDLSSFDTSNVTYMASMFDDCNSLEELDLSSFNTSNVKTMERMFWDCTVLNKIYVSEKWKVNENCKVQFMFAYCYKLEGGAGTKYNDHDDVLKYAHIDEGTSNPGYLTKKDN